MKTLEQFKKENQAWLDTVISGYVSEMTWDEGMNSHPSDYFTGTLQLSRQRCQGEEMAEEVKEYIEQEVINALRYESGPH